MKTTKWLLLQLTLLILFLPAAIRPLLHLEVAEVKLVEERNAKVTVRRGEEKTEMDLEEYVVGVVLAEMSAEFEPEALKAQAVVARTFAWKAASTGGKHGDGSVCTDSTCCQGYVSPGHFLQAYGTTEGLEKIRTAVDSTARQVLTYRGELIEATYFSSASGYTEDAAAVWGNSYPYLTAQESPEEVVEETTAFSSALLQQTLGTELGEDISTWFTDWQYTAGGGVASVKIGSRTYTGTALRQKLGLHSTAFTVWVENDVVFFQTKGSGHRVGMSQLGADTMAALGEGYEAILAYYYPGTTLESLDELSVK